MTFLMAGCEPEPKPDDAQYRFGYSAGYSAGYHEGQRIKCSDIQVLDHEIFATLLEKGICS